MMSNDKNSIRDFTAYFTSLGTAILKEQDSMAASAPYKQPFGDIVKIALLTTLRKNVQELLSIISSVKRFFIEVVR